MKRLDLQGIRGLAILSVLGFHFFPKIFPNGYLGVDQFFVLSGFLMCMLLSKSEKTEQSTWQMIINFYIRRLRRLLPLYYLIILLSLIFLYFAFPDTSIEPNESYAKNALLFMSNQIKTNEENYFELLQVAIDIFTHTWSLSVEIQFYFLAPFIFLLPFRKSSLVILSIASIAYFYYLPSSSSFFSVFSRVWQFLLGMITYILSESPDNSYELVEDLERKLEIEVQEDTALREQQASLTGPNLKISIAITVLVCFIIFYHIELPQGYVRPLLTLLTCAILIFSNDENKLLSNKVLTYIGDISYSLYLIHWPIYAYWKLTQNGDLESLFYSIIVSILLSIIIHNFFENWYLGLSNQNIAILLTFLCLGNLTILNHETLQKHSPFNLNRSIYHSLDGVTSNMTLDDAERMNNEWILHDWRNLIFSKCNYEDTKPIGWCRITDFGNESKNTTTKYKIMVIGNSWAANHAKLIYQECGNKAKMIVIGAGYGCEPLYASSHSEICKPNITHFQRHVEDFKPDYAFHVTRHISYGAPYKGDIKNDPVYSFMLNQTKILLKNIKHKFFILNAIPSANPQEVSKIVKYIKQNMTFAEIDKKIANEDRMEDARFRYSQLAKDCGEKCELFDYLPKFYKNDTQTWRFFDDRGFTYITSTNHLSMHGLEHIRDVIRGICNKM